MSRVTRSASASIPKVNAGAPPHTTRGRSHRATGPAFLHHGGPPQSPVVSAGVSARIDDPYFALIAVMSALAIR